MQKVLEGTTPLNEVIISNVNKLVWSDDYSKLIQGDALNEDLFNEEFADLIIAEPHLYVGKSSKIGKALSYEDYCLFTKKWLENCYKWSNPEGRLFLPIPTRVNRYGTTSLIARIVTLAENVGWKYRSTTFRQSIYKMATPGGSWMSAKSPNPANAVDLITMFYKGDEWKKTKGTGKTGIRSEDYNLWCAKPWEFEYNKLDKIPYYDHATFVRQNSTHRAVKLFTFEEDTVFFPFLRHGSHLVITERANRRSVGVELKKETCDEIEKYMLEHEGEKISRGIGT